MSLFRPGEFKITDKAMEYCAFSTGAKILDVGCGHGETMEYLEEKFGCEASGIDLSLPMIKEAKDRNPKLDIQYGDGEFLDNFSSFSFDGVLMECVLSLINLPDEALHEAYCVLKKGGKLVISDLYVKNPEEGLIKAVAIEAERQQSKAHAAGECNDSCAEDHKTRAVNFRVNGKFLKEPLLTQLEEIGFHISIFEDWSLELDNFVAAKLMEDGGLENCLCDGLIDAKERKQTGYFLVVAEKPKGAVEG